MIQDIAPHIYHNTYLPRAPRDGDRVLLCRPGGVFLREQPAAYPEALRLSPDGAHLRYLFAIDETAFYLWEGDLPALEAFPADEGWGWRGTEIFRFLEPRWLGFAGVTGYRLWLWYGSNRFCGRCGKPLRHHDTLRALTCPNCENLIFPTISPSVIVAVTHGDRLLLTRYAASHSSYRYYALVAGYTEIGESLEATVHREVFEETGLRVKNLRFYKSQPWPFSGAILAGFFCELDGSDQITLEQDELSEAVWLTRDEIPIPKDHSSLTNEMIDVFCRRLPR